MQQPIILSVQQITSLLKQQIETPFQRVWVQGEVANLKKASSGHFYFSLVDPNTMLQAVLFRLEASRMAILPQNGDSIIAEGQIVLFAARGTYQLVVHSIQQAGLGALLIAKQQLKKKLADLGWFREERKKPLPSAIRTIGVITSPTGAVLRDIIHILNRRMGSYHLLINPVVVQGEGAPKQLAQALYDMNRYSLADVLIVCRGGGSSEDLAAFDTEEVAKAAFESVLPIISAVGHETDYTLLDLVADMRAPTPSAAAEIVSKEKRELIEKREFIKRSLIQRLETRLAAQSTHLKTLARSFQAFHPVKTIATCRLELNEKQEALLTAIYNHILIRKKALHLSSALIRSSNPLARVAQRKGELVSRFLASSTAIIRHMEGKKDAFHRIKRSLHEKAIFFISMKKGVFQSVRMRRDVTQFIRQKMGQSRSTLQKMALHLSSLSPLFPLSKGFALVKGPTGSICTSIHNLQIDERVSLIFSDGSAQAIVKDIKENSSD